MTCDHTSRGHNPWYRSHNPGELESENDAQMIIGLPNIETDANILTVRILGAEINPYSIPRPKVLCVAVHSRAPLLPAAHSRPPLLPVVHSSSPLRCTFYYFV